MIRAVVDTSALVPPHLRRELQQAAENGSFTAIWTPWIIAELNRVLTWRWIKHPPPGHIVGDLSDANERACATAAKAMMTRLSSTFEVVNPVPPYPPAWEGFTDMWDHPVWAAAKLTNAQYVISNNTRHYPPVQSDGRHVHQDIEYIGGDAFLALLAADDAGADDVTE